MMRNKKQRMPRTRSEFDSALMHAFIAGCNHGYTVEHSCNVSEQERLGAEHWVGQISDEKFYKKWDELRQC